MMVSNDVSPEACPDTWRSKVKVSNVYVCAHVCVRVRACVRVTSWIASP